MKLRTVIDLNLWERGVLLVDGSPARALAPGRTVVWGLQRVEVLRYDTRALVIELPAEHLTLLRDAVRNVDVAPGERALVRRRGRPVRWLGEGVWTLWDVDRVERIDADGDRVLMPAVSVETFAVDALAAPVLADDVKAVMAAGEYVEATVVHGAVGLRFVDGAIDARFGPGRVAAWNVVRKVHFVVVDLRERELAIAAQEVMTKDRVSLRLNAQVTLKVHDAERVASVARDADAAVYLAAQLALRDAVAKRTLDEILADRDVLVVDGTAAVAERARGLGLELIGWGVKDLVLPGEMRTLLNRVIEAQKQAEANVIRRREETAATRALAQTAKVLGEHPLLMRLKELEAYQELAAKVGKVNVVLGAEALQKLELKA